MLQRAGGVPRALVVVVVVLLATPALFYDTTAGMVRVWLSNETFTHGFLILPISLWLICQNRSRLAALTPRPDFRALALLVPCLLGWLLASLVDVQLVRQLALVALMPLTVWLVCGLPTVMTLLFPLLYLFFAIPLGQSLIPALMEFTADFTVYAVRMVGVPVFREGLSFSLPTGNWVVVEECSGLRYLIASAALGTIFAYLTYQSWLKRSLFILASLVTPIIANGVRAWMIVMIGHVSDMRYAVGLDHLLYGWVFFGIVITLLFYIGGRWADPTPADPTPLASPGTHGETHTASTDKRQIMSAIVAVALFAGVNLLNHALAGSARGEAPLPSLSMPQTVGAWQYSADRPDSWAPRYQDPIQTIARTYVREGAAVTLHVGYYPVQTDSAEAVSSLNRLTDPYGGEWRLLGSTGRTTAQGTVNEARVRKGNTDLLVWQAWAVGGRWTANPYIAKLYQAYGLIVSGRRDGAYVALATAFNPVDDAARQRLAAFWEQIQPELQARLDDPDGTR